MSTFPSWLRSSVVLAALVWAVAACGGGDDAPSREEFARNADGVCADIERQLKSLNRINPNTPGELSAFLGQLKSRINEGVKRLSELDRPEGDAGKTADEFISTLDDELRNQAIPALDELEAAAKKRDQIKLRAAVRKLDALEETRSDQLARELGADKCGEEA
jgi:hypothetical protein